jgi:periplasmic copper chaperone A
MAVVATLAILAPACAGDDDESSAPEPAGSPAVSHTGHQGHSTPAPSPTPAPEVELTEVRARETMNDKGAVYFTARSATGDRLISASVDASVAREVQIHETVMQGGSAQMQQVSGLDIPAGGELVLKPGGYHCMLLGVQQKLSAGDTFTISLVFEKAGTISVQVPVQALQASGHG